MAWGLRNFGYQPPSYGLPRRPGVQDLLDPLIEPDYPLEPEQLTRGRQLPKDAKRQLTMQILANIATSLSGGDVGARLAHAASQNVGLEQEAVAGANQASAIDYRRKRSQADAEAATRREAAKRDQDRNQIESMLSLGDKAIEMAGGAEADPKFAAKVYSAMQERNASAIQGLLDQAPARRSMREKYQMDPDDPLALDAYKEKQKLEAEKAQEETLGPIKAARELKTHQQERDYDLAHPTPREPQRDRLWFDATTGQVINEDAAMRGAGSGAVSPPVSGYEPKPRSGQQFDDVEQAAMDAANRAQTQYEKDPYRPMDAAGNPKPFNWEAAYRSSERTLRKIAGEKKAAADPSTGNRGAPPAITPTNKGVQSPKGAPVGMGGGLVNPAVVKQRAEVERKVAAVAAKAGPMTEQQKALVRKKLATMTVEQVLAEIARRRGG